MRMIPVNSERISSVGWDGNTMFVEFSNNGAVYAYENVSEAQYRAFMNSPSLGAELKSFQREHPYHRV